VTVAEAASERAYLCKRWETPLLAAWVDRSRMRRTRSQRAKARI
jgi:hypothetical protein